VVGSLIVAMSRILRLGLLAPDIVQAILGARAARS
jgi:hypothetical protein